MKKVLFVFILCFLILSPVLALDRFSVGTGFSFAGTSEAETSAELSFVFKPFSLSYLNPYIRFQSGLCIFNEGVRWSGLKASANLELFKSMWNPLSFTMSNPGPWSPSIGGGISVENSRVYPYGEVSLFRVLDKDYMYEWFVFSATFESGIREWSVSFLRMTALF